MSHLCSNPVFPTTYSHNYFTCRAPEIPKTKFSKLVSFPTYAISIHTSPSCLEEWKCCGRYNSFFPSFLISRLALSTLVQNFSCPAQEMTIWDWLGKEKTLLVSGIYCQMVGKGSPTAPKAFADQYLNWPVTPGHTAGKFKFSPYFLKISHICPFISISAVTILVKVIISYWDYCNIHLTAFLAFSQAYLWWCHWWIYLPTAFGMSLQLSPVTNDSKT